MISTTISTTPEDTIPAAATAAATPPPDPAIASRLAALEAENAEQKRAAEFWYNKATQVSAPPAAPAAKAEPEDDTDLLDLISTGGAKAFDKYMRARGYVSKAEVDEAVNSKAAQLSTEALLLQEHPDLRDQNSEFFRATAAAYGQLKKDGVPEALAMKLAAQQAELDGFKSGKRKTAAQRTTETAEAKEAARLARVKAQSGDRNSRAAEPSGDEEDDDELTPQELHICEAMGIEPEKYKARAKQGVQMGMRHMPFKTPKKA